MAHATSQGRKFRSEIEKAPRTHNPKSLFFCLFSSGRCSLPLRVGRLSLLLTLNEVLAGLPAFGVCCWVAWFIKTHRVGLITYTLLIGSYCVVNDKFASRDASDTAILPLEAMAPIKFFRYLTCCVKCSALAASQISTSMLDQDRSPQLIVGRFNLLLQEG